MMFTKEKTLPDGQVLYVSMDFDTKFAAKHSQEPHFTVTGELYLNKHAKEPECCGQLHDIISKHFKHVDAVVRWHLCSMYKGPMHYVENALYWAGFYTWSGTPNIDYLRNTIVCGALDNDEEELQEQLATLNPIEFKAWLESRLPALMKKFKTDIKQHLPGMWDASETSWLAVSK